MDSCPRIADFELFEAWEAQLKRYIRRRKNREEDMTLSQVYEATARDEGFNTYAHMRSVAKGILK